MKLLAKNKRAKYDYEIKKTFVAGISLLGSEVKSIKNKDFDISGSFVKINKGNAIVFGMNIVKYKFETINNLDPLRNRQLLLTKREIRRINDKINLERQVVVPTKVLVSSKGLIKIEIALASSRNKQDKRQYLKEKQDKVESKKYY